MRLLLKKAENDLISYLTKIELMERKEHEDAEIRKQMQGKLEEAREAETRLRQSIALMEVFLFSFIINYLSSYHLFCKVMLISVVLGTRLTHQK